MKKILFILLFALSTANLFGQKIHFTDTTNDWKIVFTFVGDATPEYIFSQDYYLNDTIIHATTYRNFSGIGYVREDTILNKVFIFDISIGSEKVLMDYNLMIGDTFRYNSFVHVVDEIDSTLINGIWYKYRHFQPVAGALTSVKDYGVLEGIGCIEHPAFPINPIEQESYWEVYCFTNRGVTPPFSPPVRSNYNPMFTYNNATSCLLENKLLLTETPKCNSKSIVIFPNPASTSTTISAPDKITRIIFTNLLGQAVYTNEFDTEQVQVDVSKWPTGIYFVKINGSVVRKFVKE